jgi:hypothetical protein
VLRTGAYDHKGVAPDTPEAAQEVGAAGWLALLMGFAGDNGANHHRITDRLKSHKESTPPRPTVRTPLEPPFQKAALKRYTEATRGQPERLVSGSDDFTMFLWQPSTSKAHLARLTGHVQLINQVRAVGPLAVRGGSCVSEADRRCLL